MSYASNGGVTCGQRLTLPTMPCWWPSRSRWRACFAGRSRFAPDPPGCGRAQRQARGQRSLAGPFRLAAVSRRSHHAGSHPRTDGARGHLMRALLDVNVWVALFDDAHLFSERANAFVESPSVRIATCPLVENGVIRVMNLPSYGRGARSVWFACASACARPAQRWTTSSGPTTCRCAMTPTPTSPASMAQPGHRRLPAGAGRQSRRLPRDLRPGHLAFGRAGCDDAPPQVAIAAWCTQVTVHLVSKRPLRLR